MRAYSSRAVALTLDAPLKWVDNLLSHHRLPGVSRARQGVERTITDQGLLAIAVVRILTSELGLSLRHAATFASAAVESRTATQLAFSTQSGVRVAFPIEELERDLRSKMIEAVDAIARVPRGRPARHARMTDS